MQSLVENVKSLQMDSQTDGKQATRKAHLSFQLRLAKNQIFRVPEGMIVFSKPFSAPNYQPFCQLFLLQIEHFDCTVLGNHALLQLFHSNIFCFQDKYPNCKQKWWRNIYLVSHNWYKVHRFLVKLINIWDCKQSCPSSSLSCTNI